MNNIETPIFIINLERSKDRKKVLKESLDKLNLKYEFIVGVDGRKLSKKERKKHYSIKKAKEGIIKRRLTLGEIGTVYSFTKVFQKMVDENIQEAIIFEDDIIIDEKSLDFGDALNKTPQNWDIIFLGYSKDYNDGMKTKQVVCKIDDNRGTFIESPNDIVGGAYAFLINLKAVKKLLKHIQPTFHLPIDLYTGDPNLLNLYMLTPPFIDHDYNVQSTIGTSRYFLNKGLIYSIKMIYFRPIYLFLKKLLGLRIKTN